MNCKCLRCGNEWETRYDSKPKQCPKCHSTYWDQPYKRKPKKSLESSGSKENDATTN